jgi:hypothetical protein
MINNFWSFNYIVRRFREKAEELRNRSGGEKRI